MRILYFVLPAVAAMSKIPGLYTACSPNGTIMATPKFGTSGAVFTVCSQMTICGPPSKIYDVLIDFPRYDEWNTFVYDVDLPANVSSPEDVYLGMTMTFHTFGLVPMVNTTSTELISSLQPAYKTPFVAWATDTVIEPRALQSEHVSLLRDLGRGETEYVSWETFYGPAAAAVLPLKDALVTQFGNQGRDLKKRVEGLS